MVDNKKKKTMVLLSVLVRRQCTTSRQQNFTARRLKNNTISSRDSWSSTRLSPPGESESEEEMIVRTLPSSFSTFHWCLSGVLDLLVEGNGPGHSTLRQRKGRAPPTVHHVMPSHEYVMPGQTRGGGPGLGRGSGLGGGGGVPARRQRRCKRDSIRPP